MCYKPEIKASLSGGGFLNYFQRPSYQQQAASTFLRNLGNRYYQGFYMCVCLRDRYLILKWFGTIWILDTRVTI